MKYRSLLIASLIVFGLFFFGCQKEETQPEIIRPVKAMKLEKLSSFGGRSFPGRCRAAPPSHARSVRPPATAPRVTPASSPRHRDILQIALDGIRLIRSI